MDKNLPDTLRRAADFLEALIKQRRLAFIRWTPWYIEAIREAADELESLRAGHCAGCTVPDASRANYRLRELEQADKEGRLVVLENNDDPMSLDSLSLFLRNRADAVGELNEYDKMLMREASDRLAEAALKGEGHEN